MAQDSSDKRGWEGAQVFFKFILWSLGAIYLPDFSIADSNVTLPSRESVGVEEANGCEKDKDPSPDRATMEKVCHLYQFLESKHGEYKILVPGNTSRPLSSAACRIVKTNCRMPSPPRRRSDHDDGADPPATPPPAM